MTRRDNGLPGDEWQLLTDLAPPLADHVLDILRDEGIAAYAAPSTGRTGAYLETHAHERPLDEIFVGRAELDRARTVLDHVLPTLRAELDDDGRARGSERLTQVSTDDDVWAGIVAAYTAAAADDARPPADDTSPTSPRRAATGFEEIAAEVNEAKAARDEAAAAAG